MIICINILVSILFAQTVEWESDFYQLYKWEGTHANQAFGQVVCLPGDLNHDGYSDVIIGVPNERVDGENYVGRVYVYSGLDGSLLYSFTGENKNANCGYAISGLGDTNNDGYNEILIGAPGTDSGLNLKLGKVYKCSGEDGSIIQEYWGEDIGDALGRSIAAIGDINRDKIDDFLVSAEGYDINPPPFNIGAIYVYSGSTNQLIYDYYGENSAEGLGITVSKVGDVNRDGYSDFAWLMPYNNTEPKDVGYIFIYSGKNGALLKTVYGRNPGKPFKKISFCGDVNGDGWSDILVGQFEYNNGSHNKTGRVFVLSGMDWSILFTIIGELEDQMLGSEVSTAGDVNGDGFDDILVTGGPFESGFNNCGAIYIYSGRDGSLVNYIYGEEEERIAVSVHGGADINRDGLLDIVNGTGESINGISWAGSARVFVSKSLKAIDKVPLGTDLELYLNVPAQPHGLYYLAFSLAKTPGIPLGTRNFPLTCDALFLATFGNPVFSGLLDYKGKRRLKYPIPNDPGLSGLILYSAFLTLNPMAPKGVQTISNPEEILLQ